MDIVVSILVRALFGLLNLLPLALRVRTLSAVIRVVSLCIPSARRVAHRNLELAFPEQDRAWRKQIIDQSIDSLARTIVDFGRLPAIDRTWVENHIDYSFEAEMRELKIRHGNQGFMFATGHLGSFELLAHAYSLLGNKLSFVQRPFKLKRLNSWWTARREISGNRSITRNGAFKEIVQHMKEGRDVGVLYDQNVTRNHAVFVNWFGRPAATTKTVALAAMRCKVPIYVFSLNYRGNDTYKMNAVNCEVDSIYSDSTLSHDEKVHAVTQRVSEQYEKLIRENIPEWFWMHRRWKTSEDGKDDFYKSA
jgi:KDO2-lipid IV(A) lauroyltransferase